jgi:hypothetical protein
MAIYAHGNLEQIATAIGMEVEQIAKHENRFEAAARWYRLDSRRTIRIVPSKTREKLNQIAKRLAVYLRAWVSMILMKQPMVRVIRKFSTPSSWRASPTRTLS